MNLTIPAPALRAAVSAVAPAAAKRTTVPHLKMIHATAVDGRLTIVATDNEMFARITVPCHTDRNGVVVLDPEKLSGIAADIQGEIEIVTADDRVMVKTARSTFRLPWLDPTTFPEPWKLDEAPVVIDARQFQTAIRRALAAADRIESSAKWTTRGILFRITETSIVCVGTDTRRMSVMPIPTTTPERLQGDYIVPTAVFPLLEKSMSDSVSCIFTKRAAEFSSEQFTIGARLLEGRFPPFDQILPKKNRHTISLPVAESLACFRDAKLVLDKDNVRVVVEFADGRMKLTSEGEGAGQAEIEMLLPDFDGQLKFEVNPQFVIDGFRVCESETIQLLATDHVKPLVFASEQWSYVVVPLT